MQKCSAFAASLNDLSGRQTAHCASPERLASIPRYLQAHGRSSKRIHH